MPSKPDAGPLAVTVGSALGELHSQAEMLTWKREYNIRRREAQWQRRQEDALLEKQVGWELMRLDRENRLEVARESAKRRALEDRVARRHKEVERDYRNRCREAKIRERTEKWQKEENERIAASIEEARKAKEIKLVRLEEAKIARRKELQDEADRKKEHQRVSRELQVVRAANLKKIENNRKAKSLESVAAIKKSPTTAKHHMLARFAARQLDCKLDEVIFQCRPSAGGLSCLPRATTVGQEWRAETSPETAHAHAEELELARQRYQQDYRDLVH